jgi:hypothetical protein
VIGGGHTGINHLLQDDLLDVVGREAALGQCGSNVQAESIPRTERQQRFDDKHTARAIVEMWSGPDLTESIARDQFLEFGVEGVPVGDPLSTQASPRTLRRLLMPLS